MRCPLYTGEDLPIEQAASPPTSVGVGGWRGWLAGLSTRDRRIYATLVGLLCLIIVAYAISGVVLFSNNSSTTTPSTTALVVQPTNIGPTVTVSPSPNAFATAAVRQTQTAEAIALTTTATPSVSATPSASATTQVILASPTFVIVPPTEDVIVASPTPSIPFATDLPTFEPTLSPIATTVVPTVEPTIEPTLEPTIEPTIAPTVEPTIEPTTEPLPEPTAQPTEETGGREVNQLTLFYADSTGQVLVPVSRQIATTRRPRTAAIHELIAGARSDLRSLLPSDTQLLGLRLNNGIATANFNRIPTFGNSGVEDLGLRSIVLALTEQPDVSQVQLQVQGQNLGGLRYRPNVNPDNPQGLNGQFNTTSFLPLYFQASTGRWVRVMRLVPSTKTEARATIDELIRGAGRYSNVVSSAIPSTSQVRRLVIVDGVAQLDLSAEFSQTSNPRAAVDALVLALTSFSSVQQVFITIEGQSLSAIWGESFSNPFTRPELNPE
ncbi:GerMN domain-containing protein [Herpetosiphon llansteffanensis]|uniref:GerMN domain-containing protein n=1 Tax=Herpetosiphon llansteffanensis TaxID=2094568 RepID=UPI000F51AEF5|nr:GerMN domain-containing protein [Herpetosiphon llansteffanensis]